MTWQQDPNTDRPVGSAPTESTYAKRPSRFDPPTHTSGGGKAGLGVLLVVLALAAGAGVFAMMNKKGAEDIKESVAGAVEHVAPAVTPDPRVVIPSGTPVTVALQSTISTKTSNVGDRFSARLVAPVMNQGETAIPSGAIVNGRVIVVEQPGKASGRGHLQFAFDTVEYGGHSYDLGSRSAVFESKSGTDKDAAMIGGGVIGGGIIGGILGNGKGDAAKGAVVGGAAGTVASLLTRGPQLTFEPGQKIRFTLDQDLRVRPSQTS